MLNQREIQAGPGDATPGAVSLGPSWPGFLFLTRQSWFGEARFGTARLLGARPGTAGQCTVGTVGMSGRGS
jgi:hypothetical protein